MDGSQADADQAAYAQAASDPVGAGPVGVGLAGRRASYWVESVPGGLTVDRDDSAGSHPPPRRCLDLPVGSTVGRGSGSSATGPGKDAPRTVLPPRGARGGRCRASRSRADLAWAESWEGAQVVPSRVGRVRSDASTVGWPGDWMVGTTGDWSAEWSVEWLVEWPDVPMVGLRALGWVGSSRAFAPPRHGSPRRHSYPHGLRLHGPHQLVPHRRRPAPGPTPVRTPRWWSSERQRNNAGIYRIESWLCFQLRIRIGTVRDHHFRWNRYFRWKTIFSVLGNSSPSRTRLTFCHSKAFSPTGFIILVAEPTPPFLNVATD